MNGGEKQVPDSALGMITPPTYRVPVVTAPVPFLVLGEVMGQFANAEQMAATKRFLENGNWQGMKMPGASHGRARE